MGTLRRDPLSMGGIPAPDDLVHEGTVVRQISKLRRAPHQKGVADRGLEVAVSAFDGAVLMGDPSIVARGRHPIMGAQRIVAPRQIGLHVGREVTEG